MQPGEGGGRRRWSVRAGAVLTSLLAALPVVLLAGCSGSDAPDGPRITPRTGPAEIRTGVAYATVAPQQTLDLYFPKGDGRTVFPMVVLIHGGGFLEGSAKDWEGTARQLRKKGFVAASLDYRLSGDAAFPAGVQDVKAAVRFLRANAPDWGVDPRRLAVWGDSAGGYLASMIGATGGEKTFDDPALGHPDVSSAVQAVVSWYGPSDFATMDAQAKENGCDAGSRQHHAAGSPESKWLGAPLDDVPDEVERASVVRHVGAAGSLPPFLLVHGTADCTVAPGQSQQLHDALAAKGAKVTLTEVPDAGHADQKIYDRQTGPTVDFLTAVLRR